MCSNKSIEKWDENLSPVNQTECICGKAENRLTNMQFSKLFYRFFFSLSVGTGTVTDLIRSEKVKQMNDTENAMKFQLFTVCSDSEILTWFERAKSN